jgi:transcriptional regulator with XRE-family HTH domain
MKADEKLKKIIGERIKQRRLSLGWSQERLADKAGLHSKGLSRIETGNANSSIGTLDRIASALGIQLGDLFDHSQRKETALATELHKLVDDASEKTRRLVLHLFRAVGTWESGR